MLDRLRTHKRLRGILPARLVAYGLGLALPFVALMLQLPLYGRMRPAPFLFFHAAVVVVAWLAGWGPGLLATALSAVIADRAFLAPLGALALDRGALLADALFLTVAGGNVWIIERMHRSRALHAAVAKRLTEERRDQTAEAVLAEVGAAVADSLDYAVSINRLARLAVPRIADWCMVDIAQSPDPAGWLLALAHADPDREELARTLRNRYPPDPQGEEPVATVLRTGRSVFLPEVLDEATAAAARDPEHLRLLRGMGLSSLLCVPLTAGGRTFGAITFATGSPLRRYDAADLALCEEIGRHAALAVENARLYAEAQQAIQVRDDFLSIASHELKTPLSALHLLTQALLRGMRRGGAALSPEQLRPKLDAIEDQIWRQTKLINQLLDVSRITAGRLGLDLEPVDLAAVLREVAGRFTDEAERAGCPLVLRAEGPIVGRWDAMRLDQVLTNLISNAIKYGRGRPIEASAERAGDTACLTVRDQGIGISPEHQERIFERFERAVSIREYGGFGLGLWISRQIIEALGGTIAVSSAAGVGSTFVVTLPIGSAAPARPSSGEGQGPGPGDVRPASR